MRQVGGFLSCAIQILALTYALSPAVGHAVEDRSLQLYLDFESIERPEPNRARWRFHDQSKNGFLVQFFHGRLSLVPTEPGHALEVRLGSFGVVITEGVEIYRQGEGLTVSVWVLLNEQRDENANIFLMPIYVDHPPNRNERLFETWIRRSKDNYYLTWNALQRDGMKRAFHAGATVPGAKDEWFHYAAVYDPKTRLNFIYFNGEEVSREEAEGDPASGWGTPQAPRIRIWLHAGNEDLVYIDELRLYSRALSPEEIRAVMNTQNPLSVSARARLATSWGALKER